MAFKAAVTILMINNKKDHTFKSTVFLDSREMDVITVPSISKGSGVSMPAPPGRLIFLLSPIPMLLLLTPLTPVKMSQSKKSPSLSKPKLPAISTTAARESDSSPRSVPWDHLLDS
jgi:hypothetical protein